VLASPRAKTTEPSQNNAFAYFGLHEEPFWLVPCRRGKSTFIMKCNVVHGMPTAFESCRCVARLWQGRSFTSSWTAYLSYSSFLPQLPFFRGGAVNTPFVPCFPYLVASCD
jgi:hypothetical protein